jgi:hypothetical protein
MTYETVWAFHTARFGIYLGVCPEDMDPAGCFELDEDIEEVRNGDVAWFKARVAVFLNGKMIGADYLCGCAYADVSEFFQSHWKSPDDSRNTLAAKARNICSGEYFPDMVREAIADARKLMAEASLIDRKGTDK